MTRRPPLGPRARAAALALVLGGASPAIPPLAAPALAQAGEVVLENLSFAVGPATYRVPRLRVADTPLGRAEIEAIVSAASPAPLTERIAKLQAREVSASEVSVETEAAGARQLSVYRDVVLTGIGGGRIRSIASAGGTLAGGGGGGQPALSGSFGRFTAEDVDLAHMVALFTQASGSAPAPAKRLYGALTLQDLGVRTDEGAVTRVARIAARDVAARLTPDTWLGFVRLAGAHPDLERAAPDDRQRVLASFADLAEAVAFGAIEVSGAEFTTASPRPSTTRIGRIALAGAADGRPNELVVEGIEVAAGDATVRLARFSLGEIGLAGSIETLRNLPPTAAGLSPAALRKAVPTIGRIGLSGLDTTFPSGGGAGAAPMRVSLAGADLTAGKLLQGVPTDTRLTLRNLVVPLADVGGGEPASELVRLGYDRLDLSLTLSTLYEPDRQELTLRDFTLDSQDMGSFGLKAVLGSVPAAVFDPDTAVASVAFLGASARSATISLSDGGLAERLLTLKARQLGRTTEDLRRDYGVMAAVGVPAMLGASPAAKAIGQAVARFVAKPGRIVIEARARAPGGFGVADFAAGPDPASVLEKLDVTATAE